MKRLLLILLMVPCMVGARQVALDTCSSLPFQALSNDTITVSGLVSAAGAGVEVFGKTNVLIQGDGGGDDTLYYNTGGTASQYGIYIRGSGNTRSQNITVKNLWIVCDSVNSVAPTYPIQFGGSNDCLFDSLFLVTRGHNSRCFYTPSTLKNYRNTMTNCEFWNYSDSFQSRTIYQGAAVVLGNDFIDTTAWYDQPIDSFWNWKIRGCVVRRTPAQGIVVFGRVEIVKCSIYLDHHNLFSDHWVDSTRITALGGTVYDSVNGINGVLGVAQGSANSYGILCRGVGPGSRVDSNYIRRHPDSLWRGGRGIMIENASGTQDQPVTVGWNDVDISEGWDSYYKSGVEGFGFRLREESGDAVHVRIHHNEFTVYADNDGDTLTGPGDTTDLGVHRWDSSDCYKPLTAATKITFDFDSTLISVDGDSVLDFVNYTIDSNTFRAITIDDISYAYALYIQHGRYFGDTSIHIFGNTFISDGQFVLAEQSDSINIGPNTYHADSLAAANEYTYVIGENIDNWVYITDMAYSGLASDTSIQLDNNATQQITLRRSLDLAVAGSNDLPVVGATVTITNAYDDEVASLTTDSGGMVYDTVSYWFESRTETDSTAYNPFTLKAKSGTDSTSQEFTVEWNAYEDTITLTSTAGTGVWRPEVPTSITIDSLHNDISGGENDSVNVTVTASPDNTGDSIIVVIGPATPTDPDVLPGGASTAYVRGSAAMSTSNEFLLIALGGVFGLSNQEPYTLYGTAWAKTDDSVYSEAITTSILFSSANPPRPTSVTVTDSIFYNYSSTYDSVRVLVVCPPDSGGRNPDSIACAANFGVSVPTFPNVNQKWQPYMANDTLEYWFTIDGAGTFTVTAGAKSYNDTWSLSTTSGSNSFTEPGGSVSGPSSVALDSLQNDYSGEDDQLLITITTAATTGDSLYYAVASGAYPDSSDVTEIGYTASTTVYDTLVITSGVEPYMGYLSVWVVEDGAYSTRSTAFEYFGGSPASPSEGTTLKIKADLKIKAEIKIK